MIVNPAEAPNFPIIAAVTEIHCKSGKRKKRNNQNIYSLKEYINKQKCLCVKKKNFHEANVNLTLKNITIVNCNNYI